MLKKWNVWLLVIATVLLVGSYARQFPERVNAAQIDSLQPPQTPVVTVPGTPAVVNPDKPSQPAVSVKEVESPAAPSHYTDQVIWGVMVSFAVQYLKKKAWFPWISETSSERLKAQFGFATALLTAAGIHFAVTGNVLDGGAAITISGISLDALKDLLWQWAAQQSAYKLLVKENA